MRRRLIIEAEIETAWGWLPDAQEIEKRLKDDTSDTVRVRILDSHRA